MTGKRRQLPCWGGDGSSRDAFRPTSVESESQLLARARAKELLIQMIPSKNSLQNL